MYSELGTLLLEVKNIQLILQQGDIHHFDVKIGKRKVKRCSRGRRNSISEELVDFCNVHSSFITNRAF